MQTSKQEQQQDVTRRRFIQAVLQPGPVQPVIEEIPREQPEPKVKDEEVYDDQPAVFDMDEDDEPTTDDSIKGAETDSAVSPNTLFTRPPRNTHDSSNTERSMHEFMPSVAVSDQRSSSKLSSMSSSLSSSSSATSLSRLGMGRSVQPAFFGGSTTRFGQGLSDDDEDDTTIVIAPHDVTAAISQPRVAASFGFVPPHLVSDLPDY